MRWRKPAWPRESETVQSYPRRRCSPAEAPQGGAMSRLTLHTARHGDFFHFADDSVIGASLARYGEWAEQELHLMHQLVRPGDTVIDAGANVGCHTLALARFVGSEGRVIAIEAQPAMFDLLATNVTLNCATWVRCVFALADRASGTTSFALDLAAPAGNYGAVSFADGQRRHAAGGRLPVAVLALDDLCLDRCALLKIDVEGMELDVLQGAQRLLADCAPYLYFEQAADRHRAQIFALLRGLGYQLYWHVANPFNRANYNGAHINMFGGACEINVLAVPAGSQRAVDPAEFGLQPVRDEASPAAPRPPQTVLPAGSCLTDAYAELPVRPGLTHWAAHCAEDAKALRHELAQLRVAFGDLLEDRRKAQEVMDWQHQKLLELQQPA
jgi:FkbM family methyltransferase